MKCFILPLNRKTIWTVIVMLLITNKIYAINGDWIFENYYLQYIIGGKATVQSLKTNVIKRITFNNNIVNTNLGSKEAKVEIIDSGNKYVEYNAEYKDSESLIMLWVKRGNERIELWIFVSKQDDRAYWYSYAISAENLKNKKVGAAVDKVL